MSNSLIKPKVLDPFISSLVENIGEKRNQLCNLECIDVNPNFSNIESNKKGSEFYIQNQFHKAKGFRKLHVEIAEFSNLKILHCVFFPDPKFNIPIFGLDLIKTNNIISAAIVDLSPVSNTKDPKYELLLKNVDRDVFFNKRKMPEWGNIFSKYVFFASLRNVKEQTSFYNIVDKYLSILVDLSSDAEPDDNNHIIDERIFYQKNYCKQQMKNEKTSLVLLKYFDKIWVEKYITEILFDF